MSDRWTDAFMRERAPEAYGVPAKAPSAWQEGYRVASWAEIAAWCAENGVVWAGNIHPVNQARRARGRKPFALAKGPMQKGLRL